MNVLEGETPEKKSFSSSHFEPKGFLFPQTVLLPHKNAGVSVNLDFPF